MANPRLADDSGGRSQSDLAHFLGDSTDQQDYGLLEPEQTSNNAGNDEELDRPITERTGRLILQRLNELIELNSRQHHITRKPVRREQPQAEGPQPPRRCDRPREIVNGKPRLSSINNDVIDETLQNFFVVAEEDVQSIRNDLTIHLMRVCVAYIETRLIQKRLSPVTPWKNVPRLIKDRAFERFNAKAMEVLRIDISLCEGCWIAHHCIHSGWNNYINRETKRQQPHVDGQSREDRFRLSVSPAPVGRRATDPGDASYVLGHSAYDEDSNRIVSHSQSRRTVSGGNNSTNVNAGQYEDKDIHPGHDADGDLDDEEQPTHLHPYDLNRYQTLRDAANIHDDMNSRTAVKERDPATVIVGTSLCDHTKGIGRPRGYDPYYDDDYYQYYQHYPENDTTYLDDTRLTYDEYYSDEYYHDG
ncbi:hypothetical protein BCR43DRAFT_507312 [Syncephalastrum racemosum]|uniref:Uncharacterized protein n=1 Tax=Syncephalastrum racemosum TaxID=13706 RepID=A0A1X2H6J1_SYNRA|nr:hypothetical protein BCR43DRAFT_507312 [Syncephalastrum racemosum]